ncbi:MAG: DUF5110 domain-containing protein, partial [Bacteroidota bacterium]
RLSTNDFYKGMEEVTVEAPLHDLPVFARAGGIIPMQSVVQSTSQKPSPILELHIYNGKKPNSFLYYEDDGTTYQYEKGEFYKRSITFDPVKKSIVLGKVEGSFQSKFSDIRLVLHSFGELMTLKSGAKDYTLKLKSSKERTVELPMTNDEMILNY